MKSKVPGQVFTLLASWAALGDCPVFSFNDWLLPCGFLLASWWLFRSFSGGFQLFGWLLVL